MSEIRLQVVLARAGLGSRRACEALIRAGAVAVNGRGVTALGTRVDPVRDRVTVHGRPLAKPARLRHVMMHVPRGIVSTVSDPEGRPTVVDLLGGVRERMHPVGRLDIQSSGLLLLTNDGPLTDALTHPRSGLPRVYRVKVRGELDDSARARLAKGVRLEGRLTRPIVARPLRSSGNASWVEVTVHEGRNHLVRDALAAVGHPVVKLQRVAFGPLQLGRLAIGTFRDLTPAEVTSLWAAVRASQRAGGASAASAAAATTAAAAAAPRPRARTGAAGRGGASGAPPARGRAVRRPRGSSG